MQDPSSEQTELQLRFVKGKLVRQTWASKYFYALWIRNKIPEFSKPRINDHLGKTMA